MKSWAWFVLFLSVIVMSASTGFSKGIFITPGTRANGLGGAYIAVAEDPTAIYWNPAGLAQLDTTGLELSAFSVVTGNAKSNKGPGHAATPDVNSGDFPLKIVYAGIEPTEFANKEFKTSALVPFVAGHTRVNDITIALGLYGSGGGGGTWEDTVSDAVGGPDKITASLEGLYGFTVTNLSASRDVLQDLSVGLGVDYIMMTDKAIIKKAYTKNTGSALDSQFPYNLAGVTSYRLGIDKNASGSAFQVNAGALYRVMDNLRAGLVFRSGTSIGLKGTAKFDQSGLAPTQALTGVPAPDVAFRTDYESTYNYPMTYGIGVSYDPAPKWTLAAGIDQNAYSMMKDKVTYTTPLPGVFDNTDASKNLKDTTQFRLGAEFRYSDRLAFQAGVQNDPIPFKSDARSLFETNQYNMTYVTVGAGYIFDRLKINGTLGTGISDKATKGSREYEYPLTLARLALGYTF